MDGNGRNFAVEPILLVRECRPGVGHARIALMGGLSVSALGKLKTIIGVVSEDVRLFHIEDVGTELLRRNPLTGS
ncbi:3-polyprenyl-4-hydroxybenzoate decarboxylase [Bradyrhizobium yuanmingense]